MFTMRLEQFQYLIEISKYESMNIASKHLHVSQQNLSNAILKLEDELGLSLFHRTSQGVTLTNEGEFILQSAQKILSEVNKITEYANNLHAQELQKDSSFSGNIKLNLSPYFTQKKFLNIINQILLDNPLLNIEVYVNASTTVVQQVNDESDQLGLINMTERQMLDIKKAFPNLQQKILNSDQLVVLANKESEIGRQKSVSIKKLLNFKLLFYGDTSLQDDWKLELFRSHGTPQSVIKSNNEEMVITTLKNNVALLPVTKNISNIFLVDKDIVLVPVRPRLDIYNALVINNKKILNDAENMLIKNIAEIFLHG